MLPICGSNISSSGSSSWYLPAGCNSCALRWPLDWLRGERVKIEGEKERAAHIISQRGFRLKSQLARTECAYLMKHNKNHKSLPEDATRLPEWAASCRDWEWEWHWDWAMRVRIKMNLILPRGGAGCAFSALRMRHVLSLNLGTWGCAALRAHNLQPTGSAVDSAAWLLVQLCYTQLNAPPHPCVSALCVLQQ